MSDENGNTPNVQKIYSVNQLDGQELINRWKADGLEMAGAGYMPMPEGEWPFFYPATLEGEELVKKFAAQVGNKHPMAGTFQWQTYVPMPDRLTKESPLAYLTFSYKTGKDELKFAVWFDMFKHYTMLNKVYDTGRIVFLPYKPKPEQSWPELAAVSYGCTLNQFKCLILKVGLDRLHGMTKPGKQHVRKFRENK